MDGPSQHEWVRVPGVVRDLEDGTASPGIGEERDDVEAVGSRRHSRDSLIALSGILEDVARDFDHAPGREVVGDGEDSLVLVDAGPALGHRPGSRDHEHPHARTLAGGSRREVVHLDHPWAGHEHRGRVHPDRPVAPLPLVVLARVDLEEPVHVIPVVRHEDPAGDDLHPEGVPEAEGEHVVPRGAPAVGQVERVRGNGVPIEGHAEDLP